MKVGRSRGWVVATVAVGAVSVGGAPLGLAFVANEGCQPIDAPMRDALANDAPLPVEISREAGLPPAVDSSADEASASLLPASPPDR